MVIRNGVTIKCEGSVLGLVELSPPEVLIIVFIGVIEWFQFSLVLSLLDCGGTVLIFPAEDLHSLNLLLAQLHLLIK